MNTDQWDRLLACATGIEDVEYKASAVNGLAWSLLAKPEKVDPFP